MSCFECRCRIALTFPIVIPSLAFHFRSSHCRKSNLTRGRLYKINHLYDFFLLLRLHLRCVKYPQTNTNCFRFGTTTTPATDPNTPSVYRALHLLCAPLLLHLRPPPPPPLLQRPRTPPTIRATSAFVASTLSVFSTMGCPPTWMWHPHDASPTSTPI